MNKMEDVIKIYHASNDVDAEIILERLRDCGIEGYISEAHSVYPKIYSGSMNGSVIWGSDIYINAQDEERARELLQQWDREAEKDVEILSDQARNAKEIPEDVQEFLAQRADSKMGDEDWNPVWFPEKTMPRRSTGRVCSPLRMDCTSALPLEESTPFAAELPS